MVGVRRAGVTEALHELVTREVVSTARGTVTVRDRKALEQIAGSLYGIAEREYQRVIKV
jgi:hypothetical protein